MKRRRGGFSLIEALVALMLICLVLIVLLNVFGTGRRAVQQARTRGMALQLGRQVLDQAAKQGYANVTAVNGQKTLSWLEDGRQAMQTVIYQVQTENLTGLRKGVWVNVSWETGGVNRSIVLETRLVKLP